MHINFRLMAAIFSFQHTQTLDSLCSSLVVLVDLGNMDIAVGILFLSCIQAEIYVNYYLISGNDSNLQFPAYPDADSLRSSLVVLLDLGKHGYSCWNFVAFLYMR